MALLRNRSCHSVRLILVVGMMLGAVLVIIVALFFWSLSPLHETVMVPRVMSSLPMMLDMSGSPLVQRNKGGGGGGKCVCRQESGSGLESKHDGALDGHVSSSFQDTIQTSSLHYLDVASPAARIQQPLLAGAEQQAVQATGGADTMKEVKQDGVLKQQLKQQLRSVDVGDYRGRWVFQSLKEGKKMRETLVMAVIIGGKQLEWAKSVYATWGHDASHLVFYTEGQSNISIQETRRLGLQVVKLNASTKMHTRLALLQHLSEHYGKSHQWFVVVTENTYVHMDQLEAVLGRLSPEEPLLLGLPPHCQVRGQRRNGSSMVLNQALLSLLTHQLHLCLNENMDVADSHGSAEIEACVDEHLNIHCSKSSLMQPYFVEVEEGQTSISARLPQSHFSFLLTYSPLRLTKDMYILHYHYKKTQLMAAVEKTKHLQQEVKQVCNSLGPSFLSAKDCYSTLLREVVQSHNQSSFNFKCPTNGEILTTPEPFHPMSIHDYLPWEYFDARSIYRDQSTQPNYSLRRTKSVEKELRKAVSQAIQTTSKGLGRHIKLKKLVNGWVRHDPIVGNEYIIDSLFKDKEAVISKRVHLVRPLATNYISLKDEFVDSVTVTIVVPISGVSQRFTKFMSMYENIVFIPRNNVNLILTVYGREDLIKVDTVLSQYRLKYEYVNIKVVEGEGEFSRSKALHLGLSRLLPNDLVFICDVDIVISRSFLDRCRSNTIQKSRVYFPEFFKQYNMEYVYWNRSKPSQTTISRENGHWAYYSFGMLCIYKSDYDSVGGMDTKITGWGGEDVTFFLRILRRKLQIMRTPDVGLSHSWHPKICPDTLSALQYSMCQSSREEHLADTKDLARFVYGHPSSLNFTTPGTRPTRTTTISDSASQEH